jgi:hypothetical protein
MSFSISIPSLIDKSEHSQNNISTFGIYFFIVNIVFKVCLYLSFNVKIERV